MKPTTQAKTTNQLCSQLEAMKKILASVMAGATDLGINSCRNKYARDEEPNLGEALLALHKALRVADSIAISANTKVYNARVRERNTKYKYLRTEYRARQTECPIEKKRLMALAARQRECLANTPELEARIQARQDREERERQASEQRQNEWKKLQENLQRVDAFLARKPSQQPELMAA